MRMLLTTTSVLTIASLLCAAAPASATTDLEPTSIAATDMPSTTRTVSCSAGGMTGEARLTLASDGTKWRTTVDSYRISSNGRNKANINPYMSARNFVGQVTLSEYSYSRDAMIQDGQWHSLGLTVSRSSLPWNAMSQSSDTGVQFVFDKSGSDPRCHAGISSSGANRSVTHTATRPGTIDRLRPLASCKTLTDGITCSIAETRSVSSTLTLSGSSTPTGESWKWLTAGVNSSWTNSRTIDVRCTSPAMRRDQLFVAYPMGTTSEFRVQVNAFGVRIDGPGTAFEVAPGIACEVV